VKQKGGDYSFYSKESYWESRFANHLKNNSTYNYLNVKFEDLKPLLDMVIKAHESVLEIGCGNAPLLGPMRDSGHHGKLLGVDISKSAIEQVGVCHDGTVDYQVMDTNCLSLSNASFDHAIDKGLFDALLLSDDNHNLISQTFKEVSRVLDGGGSCIIISHRSPYDSDEDIGGIALFQKLVIPALLQGDTTCGQWQIDVHSPSPESEYHVWIMSNRTGRKTRATAKQKCAVWDGAIQLHRYDE
jgi:ubiquinone/menaquinone biosynthesis C-methylase UbiE